MPPRSLVPYPSNFRGVFLAVVSSSKPPVKLLDAFLLGSLCLNRGVLFLDLRDNRDEVRLGGILKTLTLEKFRQFSNGENIPDLSWDA